MKGFCRSACELRFLGTRTDGSFLINDTYRTDVHLLYPPYVISLAVLYIGFCLTAMNNPTGARTRSSSSQVNSIATSMETNKELGLPPPPSGAAEFLASFEVSFPVLLACVQDIIVLYPIWEAFEPSNNRAQGNAAAGSAPGTAVLGAGTNGAPGKDKDTKDKFGVEEAEALVRRMIEERAVDLSHPDNAGKPDDGKKSSNGSPTNSLAGKKRPRA
jgi:cyclin C